MSLDGQKTAEERKDTSSSSQNEMTPPRPQTPEVSKVEVETGTGDAGISAKTPPTYSYKTSIITTSSPAVPMPSDLINGSSTPSSNKPLLQQSVSTPSTSISTRSISPDERRSTFISTSSSITRSSESKSPSSQLISPVRPLAYSISPSSLNGDSSNAVTVIKVQSGGGQEKEDEITTTSASLNEIQSESKVLKESEGVAITRINVTGGFSSSQGNVNGNQNIQNQDSRSTRSSRSREGSQRSLRLGRGQVEDGNEDDDGQSEVSSVVNNPSIISQAPDRYGFTGGEQYTHESEPDPPPEIIRRREMKWLAMLDKWDHYMKKDFKTVRSRCRKGIPRSVRGRAWYYLCGAAFIKKKNPDLFHTLCQQEGKPECVEDIKKDLHRQFPWHEIFAEEGHGQRDLFNVLKAHSILNAKDGYCQAQAPIAAILLMHMPSEDAFWCLVAICEKYLKGYYSPGMAQLQLDGDILFGLLKRVAPPVYKHMKKQKIDPVLYMTEWFLCAFTRTLPWPSVLRVWDTFLCEGVKILFRVGLVLLKYTLGRSGVLKQCPNMYDTLMMLKNLPNYVTHEQFLVVQVYRLDMSDDQMRREHYKQVVKRKKAQQKLDAAKKQQEKSRSAQGVNNTNSISAATLHKSHETAL